MSFLVDFWEGGWIMNEINTTADFRQSIQSRACAPGGLLGVRLDH